MKFLIETIKPEDYSATKRMVYEAFLTAEHRDGDEHELIERLRGTEAYVPELEVVAKKENQIVGYGLLTKINILSEDSAYQALVLAPLAVSSTCQHQGVGAAILRELEIRAKRLGYVAISILGEPAYYQKFGYFPASQAQIRLPFDVPDAYSLIKFIGEKPVKTAGVIQYSSAFGF